MNNIADHFTIAHLHRDFFTKLLAHDSQLFQIKNLDRLVKTFLLLSCLVLLNYRSAHYFKA